MLWLLLGLIVVAVLLDILSRRLGRADESSYLVALELHAIRRRMEVAHLKHQIRGSAIQARRKLRDELDALDHESDAP